MQVNETVSRGERLTERRQSDGLPFGWRAGSEAGRGRASLGFGLLLVGVLALVALVGSATVAESVTHRLAQRVGLIGVASSDRAAQPVAQLEESVTARLLEDESLRSRLSDDESERVLAWALVKVRQSAESYASAPAPSDASCFNQSSDQLIDLMRILDLTIGERAEVEPAIFADRLRQLEAVIEPPLFEGDTITVRRSSLAALRLESAGGPRFVDDHDLVPRLIDALR